MSLIRGEKVLPNFCRPVSHQNLWSLKCRKFPLSRFQSQISIWPPCSILTNITSSFAHFAHSATSPLFAYVSNPAPDSSLQSCCSPIASASAAAPRLHPIRFNCMLLRPFQLLLPDCVHFNCCSPIASISAAAPHRFSCCFPIASGSTAAPRLRPLQLLLPDGIRLQPQLFQPMPSVLKHSPRISRFSKLKYKGRASLV